MQFLRKILRKLFFPLIAALLLFEEWGWEPLAALFARFARLPLWAWLERKITQLPPRGALLVFGVPMLALLPVKLLAIYLFGKGQATLGLILLLSAKVGGTALLARLFQLTQPTLLQLRWFAWWYPRWKAWKDGVLAEVHRSAAWRAAQSIKRSAKAWLTGLRS
jgi:hypothetical protein